MTRRSEEDELDDDGGITGWEVGDADRQLVDDGGVTMTDEGLAKFGRWALIGGLVALVVYMMVQASGRTGF